MTNYVLGFCFSNDMCNVALIKKNKPEWQNGLLNGIGGKIEPNELPIDAMQREFMEETGVMIHDWTDVGSLSSDEFCVHIFKTVTNLIYDVKTMETETVDIFNTSDLFGLEVIPNLHWIIPAILVGDFTSIEAKY